MSVKAWNATLEIIKSGKLNIEIDVDDDAHADYVARYFCRLYEALKLVEDGTFPMSSKE